MTTVKVMLTMVLRDSETGNDLNSTQRRKAYDDAAHAIQNRLFGEGFLADDVEAERWFVEAAT